jgi:hypothetical protein
MISNKLLIGSAFAAVLLVGCGGGSSDSTPASSNLQTGYFVDAAVSNADYDCVADGSMNKKTGPDGSFQCQTMAQVRFRLGDLVLGEVAAVPADRYVFPQDLIGVPRDSGVNDARVAAMAQMLQSLDTDGNPANGISIAQEEKEVVVGSRTNFNPSEVPVYLESASVNPQHIKTREQAQEHLRSTVQSVAGTAAANAASNAANTAHDAANNAANTANNAANNAVNTAHDAANNAANTANDAASNAANTAQDAANNAADTAHDAAQHAANTAEHLRP